MATTPKLRVIAGGRRCPICAKPAEQKFRPFCSKRCADIDMGRWLKESYAVPGENLAPNTDSGADSDADSDAGAAPDGGPGGADADPEKRR